jgi:hypothetical protein
LGRHLGKIISALFIASLFLISSGCGRYSIAVPGSFAYENKKGALVSYSPEGVKYSVRGVKNQPRKSFSFWSEALKNQLEEEGNILMGMELFNPDNGEGIKYLWLMPFGQDYYIYMTAIAVNSRSIVIAEAAAEKTLFEKYQEEISTSLESLTLR